MENTIDSSMDKYKLIATESATCMKCHDCDAELWFHANWTGENLSTGDFEESFIMGWPRNVGYGGCYYCDQCRSRIVYCNECYNEEADKLVVLCTECKIKPAIQKSKYVASAGLNRAVYVDPGFTKLANQYVLNSATPIPIDESLGNGICTREMMTKILVSYIHTKGLQHPVEKGFFVFDNNLLKIITPEQLQILQSDKNKRFIKTMEHDGKPSLYFAFAIIAKICIVFIITALAVPELSKDQEAKLDAAQEYLKSLTELRKESRSKNISQP